jgi:hypothetical protein
LTIANIVLSTDCEPYFTICTWDNFNNVTFRQVIVFLHSYTVNRKDFMRLLTGQILSGVSTVSFTGSFPQILWSLQRSYLPIQPFFGPHAVWYFWYQSLSRSWHTDLDYRSYRLSNVEIGLMAGVTGQQGTPSWHLIPPLIYSEVRVRPLSDKTYEIDYWLLFLSFQQDTVLLFITMHVHVHIYGITKLLIRALFQCFYVKAINFVTCNEA